MSRFRPLIALLLAVAGICVGGQAYASESGFHSPTASCVDRYRETRAASTVLGFSCRPAPSLAVAGMCPATASEATFAYDVRAVERFNLRFGESSKTGLPDLGPARSNPVMFPDGLDGSSTTPGPRTVATNSFEPSDKHDQVRDGVGAQPRNGQSALDRSVQVSDTSSRRVGVDAASGQIVVFDETFPGQCVFHGHVRTWDQLTPKMRSALYKAGLTDLKGRIL